MPYLPVPAAGQSLSCHRPAPLPCVRTCSLPLTHAAPPHGRFCKMLKRKLDDPQLRGKKIYFYSSHHPHRRTNAAVLICAFCVLYLDRTADEAYKPFKKFYPRFTDFHDASPIACTYKLTVCDCLQGIEKAYKARLFDFANDGGEPFKIEECVQWGPSRHPARRT